MENESKKRNWPLEWALFLGIWGHVFMALPFVWIGLVKACDKKEIAHNQAFEAATIDRIEERYHAKTGTVYLRFHYHYQYRNRLFKDDIDYTYIRYFVEFTKEKRELIKHKTFPVILYS